MRESWREATRALALLLFAAPVAAAGPGYRVGDVIADFTAADQSGTPVSIHDFAGKVVAIQFCAAYCTPCRSFSQKIPAAQAVLDAEIGSSAYGIVEVLLYGNSGGVSTLVDAEAWEAFAGTGPAILHAGGDGMAGIFDAFAGFELVGFPNFIVLDPDLRIVRVDTTSGASFPLAQELIDAQTFFSTPHPPGGVADSYGAAPGVQLDVLAADGVLANDLDANGDALTAEVDTLPGVGSLTLSPDGSFSYTPPGDFVETTFTYRAKDPGLLLSDPVTVTISADFFVAAVDDAFDVTAERSNSFPAPSLIANDAIVAPIEESPIFVDAVAGADAVFVAPGVTTDTEHGEVSVGAEGGFTYTPDPGYSGPDSFDYRIVPGDSPTSSSSVGTVAIDVIVRPTLHFGNAFHFFPEQLLEYFEDEYFLAVPSLVFPDIYVDANPGGGALTLFVADPPEHGDLTFESDGRYTYLPGPDFESNGGDSFKVQATDGAKQSNLHTVTILPADGHFTRTDVYSVPKSGVLIVPAGTGLLANDTVTGGGSMEVLAVGFDRDGTNAGNPYLLPSGATVTVAADGSFTYDASGAVALRGGGIDAFFYEGAEIVPFAEVWSSAVILHLEGAPANLDPSADAGGPYEVEASQAIGLDATGSIDPEAGGLSYLWSVSAGSLDDSSLAAPTFTAPATSAVATATVTVTDPLGGSDVDSAEIVVFGAGTAHVFIDGFDGGSTAGWSATVP